ncbi:hypothetical protein HYH03_002149 [Edaphochlamys debaryana]|uniref:ARC6 IMS domain-containing protein n=1 Tax=Edaphochlamys debaryana TaxID=47281 RepID=A0A836C5D1_9CHLO|nr:hypothetical protein HYH03_002149 [Edaphochlamys debaryana]|eukprot:KAG2499858.1 hypothetical protein HYH03_002149 [Edaphochlamys debaryana]
MKPCVLRQAPLHSRVAPPAPRLGVSRPRPALHVTHFRKSTGLDLREATVQLPVEGQQLLGLSKLETFKDSELNTQYEQLVVTPVEAGYSEDAIDCRLEALDYIRRDLISSKGRARDNRDLVIPSHLLPGVIALMTEVGENELAIALATDLLESGEPISNITRRDLYMSLAMANCGLAGEILEGGSPQVGQGCAYLEAALQHLELAGEPPLAPALANQIRQGLSSLRFQGAMDTLSGPTGPANVDQRKRALRVMRDAIRAQSHATQPAADTRSPLSLAVGGVRAAVAPAFGGSAAHAPAAPAPQPSPSNAPITQDTMETLMGNLTCEEVVNLLEWEQVARHPGAHSWLYPGLLEAVAVAHIVHGFVCRQPAYVKMALSLVQQLPSTADLLVVEAVCHVLLGAVNQAAAALQQAEASAKSSGASAAAPDVAGGALPASRDAYRFVVARSQGGDVDDGLLPGLCLLTERWMSQAAFPFFRDTAGPTASSVSLVAYFDDTRVETLLTVYDAKSGGQLAETINEAFEAIRKGLRKAEAAGLLAIGAVEGADASAEPTLAQRQKLYRLVGGGVALIGAIVVGLMTPPGQRLLGRGEGAAVALMRQSTPLQPLMIAPEEFDEGVARKLLQQWQAAKAWALGAYHTTDQLSMMLAEPLLAETLDKVATLRSHGAHMRFKLMKLKVAGIKRVTVKSSPAVRISAVVEDCADLHNDADGKPVNTSRRSYDAEYLVVRGKDGVWRMSSTSVVEHEAGRK